ncbi:sensor histidine kinase [Pedosphaera parvula]|uniref:histidine kinase n=1 Tax=Pedosphaera parvula (strain Ellin514) TaxID=320771 RepID=B9XP08_PEDPL|nr:PAS domain-containing sensor histidine kinase [Pedosphaera parvula]EEF58474.1 PAS/PAC sensor signal transduction histidine kinase [Pedosphaera parvula Ellin514]
MQEDAEQKSHPVSESAYRLLVEEIKDYAIFLLDTKGIISSWNQGAMRIKGYQPAEIIGKHFSIFFPPEDVADDKPSKELKAAIQEGRYEAEGWRLRKDGSRFWASVVITALRDKDGQLAGFAKVTRDLTAKKMEEEALRSKTRELESFAHTVSHDLRAPLRSIGRFSDLLAAECGSKLNEEEKHFLGRIRQSVESMEVLLKGILEYSRVGFSAAELRSLSLEDCLKDVCAMNESEIQNSSAGVEIVTPMPHVLANRTLLVQIFSNLIGNALKYVSEGRKPEIKVWAKLHGQQVTIFVKDNGTGIQEQDFARIFNLFERLATGPSNIAGTGVGLAIVKKAAERMGGTIEVACSTINEGSIFRVSLPAADSGPRMFVGTTSSQLENQQ